MTVAREASSGFVSQESSGRATPLGPFGPHTPKSGSPKHEKERVEAPGGFVSKIQVENTTPTNMQAVLPHSPKC
jgi:hypothetical protein